MNNNNMESSDVVIENIEVISFNRGPPSQMQAQQKYTGAIRKSSAEPFSAFAQTQPAATEYLPRTFDAVVKMINTGFRVCVLMRGLPGSGKSFLAEELVARTVKNTKDHIFSADKFFIDRDGRYKFDPSKLKYAHEQSQLNFTQHASKGWSPLIVDNTNMCLWEMFYYCQVASQYKYHIEIMEPETPWKFAEGKLAAKNSHGVPIETLKAMKFKYEAVKTTKELMNAGGFDYNYKPAMREFPAIVKEVPVRSDLIDFGEDPADGQDIAAALPYTTTNPFLRPPPPIIAQASSRTSDWQTALPTKNGFANPWAPPSQVYEQPNQPETAEKSKSPVGQEKPKKNGKNRKKKKTKSPQVGLQPHRKNCPNENASFAYIRECYPLVNNSCLWDYFEKCNGDAAWCVNLLLDQDLTPMNSSSDLSCSCSSLDTASAASPDEAMDDEIVESPPRSPPGQSKKAKQEAAKLIELEELRQTKEAIERSITMAPEHYPEHVQQVKSWKNPSAPMEEPLIGEEMPDIPQRSYSPDFDIGDELHALTISEHLIYELDEEYGGGLLKHLDNEQRQFPPKIFIKKSTAHSLYLDVMQAFYSQKEEMRLQTLKDDEEFAKKLSQEVELPRSSPKRSKKTTKKEEFEFKGSSLPFENGLTSNTWKDDDNSDPLAVKLSKEKLIQMFPGIDRNQLMEIFEGVKYNFQETVDLVQDSLMCSEHDRKRIAMVQLKLFNTPWQETKEAEGKSEPIQEEKRGIIYEQLKTIEDLRQDAKDSQEEQQVCFNKAGEAIQAKNYELATYYGNIAKLHKQKAEEARHEAANLLASVHEVNQSSDSQLDLHYLNLVEAKTVLGTFLDKNIARLRATKKPYKELYVITGRGLHSVGGVAHIKISTMKICRERGLNVTEKNPGLLSVKIFQQSKMSNE